MTQLGDSKFIWCSFLVLIFACSSPQQRELKWSTRFSTLGTFSSPKCADLNGDGILDVVIGAGENEFVASDSSVLALNGVDGSVLWTIAGRDQMFGSAVFADMNKDQNLDVIIAGRAAQLKCIDGPTGKLIWEFKVKHNERDAKGYTRFNFFNPQIINDQDNDGIQDLLISNGGNIAAYLKDGSDRSPGTLALLSGMTGAFIAVDTMPDRSETYMCPLLVDLNADGRDEVIYGSGGEMQGGSLYVAQLEDLLNGDLSNSHVLITKSDHGFIAPPTIVDLNQDGHLDIIANWHGGAMIAFDGKTLKELWSYYKSGTEINAMATPGDVNGDQIPDFFITSYKGRWPNNKGAFQVVIDGVNGQPLYQDSIGCAGLSSAIAYDFDQDGRTEFLFSTNQFNCSGIYLGDTEYKLHLLDINDNKRETWLGPFTGKNLGSTPWLGDLDEDGDLEMINCIQANYNDLGSFYGLIINRIDLGIEARDGGWKEYMDWREITE